MSGSPTGPTKDQYFPDKKMFKDKIPVTLTNRMKKMCSSLL